MRTVITPVSDRMPGAMNTATLKHALKYAAVEVHRQRRQRSHCDDGPEWKPDDGNGTQQCQYPPCALACPVRTATTSQQCLEKVQSQKANSRPPEACQTVETGRAVEVFEAGGRRRGVASVVA